MRDQTLGKSNVNSIDPAVLTADTNGASADLADHEAATVLFIFGESGDTLSGSVYWQGVVQESDNDSTFSDVADADLTTTEPTVDAAAEDDAIYMVGYVGHKRYIRAKIDATGTHTNGTPIAAVIVRERGRHVGGSAV